MRCARRHARKNLGWAETYRCGACGLEIDRDVNGAGNVLAVRVIGARANMGHRAVLCAGALNGSASARSYIIPLHLMR